MQCVAVKNLLKSKKLQLLSSLGIKTPLSKIPLVGSPLFQRYWQVNTRYKMNETANKFLLVRDKFMSRMHLRQPVLKYSYCGPFNKNKGRIKKFNEAGDSQYVH